MENKEKVSMNELLSWSSILYRSYNVVAASLLIYHYANNPNASFLEYVPRAVLHGLEVISPEAADNLLTLGSVISASRAVYGFYSGDSTLSKGGNALAMVAGSVNLSYRIS